MVPTSPSDLDWQTVVYIHTPATLEHDEVKLFIHRCVEHPRITWHVVNVIGRGHREFFQLDGIQLERWDAEQIEDRLRLQHPILWTQTELKMDASLDPQGRA